MAVFSTRKIGPRLTKFLEDNQAFTQIVTNISLAKSPAELLERNNSNWKTYDEKIRHVRRRINAYQRPVIKELKKNQAEVREDLWINNKLNVCFTKQAMESLLTSNYSERSLNRISYIELSQEMRLPPLDPPTPLPELPDEEPAGVRPVSTRHFHLTDNVIQIGAPEVWKHGYEGQGVLVAVIDSGIDYKHPALQSRMWDGKTDGNPVYVDGQKCVNGYDFADKKPEIMDDHGHGTFVAGVIAAVKAKGRQVGIAPQAKLMGLKISRGVEVTTTDFRCWRAMQFAAENKAHIICMAWTFPYSQSPDIENWRTACETLHKLNIVHVNAAGNNGMNLAGAPKPFNVDLPASCPPPALGHEQALKKIGGKSSILACGAAMNDDSLDPFSSKGPSQWPDYPSGTLIKPDLCAPGENIISCLRHNDDGQWYVGTGWVRHTSAATPHVAGALALLISAAKEYYWDDHTLQEIILLMALKCKAMHGQPSINNNNVIFKAVDEFGAGRLDVYAAFKDGLVENVMNKYKLWRTKHLIA